MSPGEVSNFCTFVCAQYLDAISEIMNKTWWSFAIAADALMDAFRNSKLDSRVKFPMPAPVEPLLPFHFMSIPLIDKYIIRGNHCSTMLANVVTVLVIVSGLLIRDSSSNHQPPHE